MVVEVGWLYKHRTTLAYTNLQFAALGNSGLLKEVVRVGGNEYLLLTKQQMTVDENKIYPVKCARPLCLRLAKNYKFGVENLLSATQV